jgi:WD40 repeat protein
VGSAPPSLPGVKCGSNVRRCQDAPPFSIKNEGVLLPAVVGPTAAGGMAAAAQESPLGRIELDVSKLMNRDVIQELRRLWPEAVARTFEQAKADFASGTSRKDPSLLKDSEEGISDAEFVKVLLPEALRISGVLPHSIQEVEVVAEVLELFEMIDADDSGIVTWDEFTLACLEMVQNAVGNDRDSRDLDFHWKQDDKTARELIEQRITGNIVDVKFFPDLQLIAVAESASTIIRLLNPFGRLVANLHAHLPPELKPDERRPTNGIEGVDVDLLVDNKSMFTKLQKWRFQKQLLQERALRWAKDAIMERLPGNPDRKSIEVRCKASRIVGNEYSRDNMDRLSKVTSSVDPILGDFVPQPTDPLESPDLDPLDQEEEQVDEFDETSVAVAAVQIADDFAMGKTGLKGAQMEMGGKSFKLPAGHRLKLTSKQLARRTKLVHTHSALKYAEKRQEELATLEAIFFEQLETAKLLKKAAKERYQWVCRSYIATEAPDDTSGLGTGFSTRKWKPPSLPRDLQAALNRRRAKVVGSLTSGAAVSAANDAAAGAVASSTPAQHGPLPPHPEPFHYSAGESGRVRDLGVTLEDFPDPHDQSSRHGEEVLAPNCCLGVEFCRPKRRLADPTAWRQTSDADVTPLLAITTNEGSITTWHTKTMTFHGAILTLDAHFLPTWSDSANALFTAVMFGKDIYAWDLLEATKLAVFHDAHSDVVTSLVWEPRTSFVLSGGGDGNILVWDGGVKAPSKITADGLVGRHDCGVKFLATIPTGPGHLVSIGFLPSEVFVWNVSTRVKLFQLPGHSLPIIGVTVTQDKPPLCITGDVRGIFRVWPASDQLPSGSQSSITSFQSTCPEYTLNGLAYSSPAGDLLTWNNRVHRLARYAVTKLDPIPSSAIYSVALATIIISVERSVRIVSATTGETVRVLQDVVPDEIVSMALDRRERKLSIGDASGNLKQIAIASGFALKQVDEAHRDDVTCLVPVFEDSTIVSVSWDRSIAVYHDTSDSLDQLRRLENAHASDISAASVNRSLNLIATGSVDGAVRLWAYDSLDPIAELEAHTNAVSDMEFASPDDRLPVLFSCDQGGAIRCYAVPPSHLSSLLLFELTNTGPSGSPPPPNLEAGVPPPPDRTNADVPIVNVPVTCLEIVCEKDEATNAQALLLFTGDGQGRIKFWDVAPFLSKFPIEHADPSRLAPAAAGWDPHQQRQYLIYYDRASKPRRLVDQVALHYKLRLRQAPPFMRLAKFGTPEWFGHAGTHHPPTSSVPVASSRAVPGFSPSLQFTGHTNFITNLHYISDPPSLISTSQDGSVRVWDMRGAPIGVAMAPPPRPLVVSQPVWSKRSGAADRTVSLSNLNLNQADCPWGFSVDEGARLEGRRRRARTVLAALRPEDNVPKSMLARRLWSKLGATAALTVFDDVSEQREHRTARDQFLSHREDRILQALHPCDESVPTETMPGLTTASAIELHTTAMKMQAGYNMLPTQDATACLASQRAAASQQALQRIMTVPEATQEPVHEIVAEMPSRDMQQMLTTIDSAQRSEIAAKRATAIRERDVQGPETVGEARVAGISVATEDIKANDRAFVRITLPTRFLPVYRNFVSEAKSRCRTTKERPRSAVTDASPAESPVRSRPASASVSKLRSPAGRRRPTSAMPSSTISKSPWSLRCSPSMPKAFEASGELHPLELESEMDIATVDSSVPLEQVHPIFRPSSATRRAQHRPFSARERLRADAPIPEAPTKLPPVAESKPARPIWRPPSASNRPRSAVNRVAWSQYGKCSSLAKDGLPHNFGGVSRDKVRTIVRMFTLIDPDGSGTVTVEEFLNNPVIEASAISSFTRSLFRSLDTDRSGTLTLTELVRVAFPGLMKQQMTSLLAYAHRFHQEQTMATKRLVEAAKASGASPTS